MDDIDFLYDSSNIKREPLEDPDLDGVNNYNIDEHEMVEDHPDWVASGSLQKTIIKKEKDLVTTKKTFTCKICNSTFDKLTDLRKHKNESGHKKTYLTPTMKKKMLENDPNLDPSQFIDKIKPQCPVCHKTYYNRKNLRIHMASIHEGKKDFSCSICDYKTKSKQELERHDVTKHELNGQSVDETNISEFYKNPKIAAFLDRNVLKKATCKICGKIVYGKDTHMKQYHSSKDGKFDCPKCDKKFSAYMQLYYHIVRYVIYILLFFNLFLNRYLVNLKKTPKKPSCGLR